MAMWRRVAIHLKSMVKESKIQEGSSTLEKKKVDDNENTNSPEALKDFQNPNSKQFENPRSLMLEDARPLDQPSTSEHSRSRKYNEMQRSPPQMRQRSCILTLKIKKRTW